MKLILDTPFWYILLCITLGAIVAFLLYRKDKNLTELSVLWTRIIAGLRFISVSIIAFLLLEPLLESTNENVEKPIIVIAQDNSESVLINSDSLNYQRNVNSKIKNLKTLLKMKLSY